MDCPRCGTPDPRRLGVCDACADELDGRLQLREVVPAAAHHTAQMLESQAALYTTRPRHGAGVGSDHAPTRGRPEGRRRGTTPDRESIPEPGDANATIPTTRRQYRHYRAREVEWLPVPADAGELLAGLGETTERVYLIGPRPGLTAGGLRAWTTAELPEGWAHHERGHYMEGEGITLRYVRADGRRVDVMRAASWFGPDRHDYLPSQAERAYDVVGRIVRACFDQGAQLLATPATTGRDLILRSIPNGREWPTMPAELQQLVRATTGQGRIEMLPPAADELPALYQLDGRLMYAALTWGLPCGEPRRENVSEYLGPIRARYRVTFTVPSDWRDRCLCGAPGHARIGLLGVHDDAGGWRWPAEPGERHETWADGAEVAVALDHGWRLDFSEAITFPPSNVGPLDGWRRRMEKARTLLASPQGIVDELAHRALRAVILHAIGALHGSPHRTTRVLPLDQAAAVPADASNLRVEGDHLLWSDAAPAAWPEMSHPEWSSAVWGRARARLLQAPAGAGALRVPASTVVAFRTDAVYLTANPRWPDDRKPGRFRMKTAMREPAPWPATGSDLLRLREE